MGLSVVKRLHETLAEGVDIMVLADRGFGDQRLFANLDTLGWSYAVRCKQNTTVTHDGQRKPAADWVPSSAHAKMLRDAPITQDGTAISGVVLKHQKGIKESWCIATNRVDLGAAEIVQRYARRFTIEETFRDIKNNHFGMGLFDEHPQRRPPRQAALHLGERVVGRASHAIPR